MILRDHKIWSITKLYSIYLFIIWHSKRLIQLVVKPAAKSGNGPVLLPTNYVYVKSWKQIGKFNKHKCNTKVYQHS